MKDNVGLTNLWKNHLCKFPAVTLDTAEAILTEYPTATKLIDVSFFGHLNRSCFGDAIVLFLFSAINRATQMVHYS